MLRNGSPGSSVGVGQFCLGLAPKLDRFRPTSGQSVLPSPCFPPNSSCFRLRPNLDEFDYVTEFGQIWVALDRMCAQRRSAFPGGGCANIRSLGSFFRVLRAMLQPSTSPRTCQVWANFRRSCYEGPSPGQVLQTRGQLGSDSLHMWPNTGHICRTFTLRWTMSVP